MTLFANDHPVPATVEKGRSMEIARHEFYVFDLDRDASLLRFIWTDKTAAMTDEDYKAAISRYAALVVEHRTRRALVDLRRFRHHPGPGLGSWWQDEIVPLYHRAGLQKLAFVVPSSEAAPAESPPAQPAPGQDFLTARFGSEEDAISWLTAIS